MCGAVFERSFPMTTTIILGVLVLNPMLAEAGEPRTHDGFFLRLSGGVGHAETGISLGAPTDEGSPDPIDEEGRTELGGLAGDFNVAIGAMVSPTVALHGTLLHWRVQSPTISYEDPTIFPDRKAEDPTTMTAFCAGITYYFMPINIYVSPSAGVGSASVWGIGNGPALDLTIGKEWWVDNNWGFGIASAIGYHSFSSNLNENYTGLTYALRFSATLN